MGATLSEHQERFMVASPPGAASPATPAPPAAPGEPSAPAQAPVFKNCWSCRVLSGSGLIGAGAYVYWAARKPMKLGYAPGPGTITQMVVGISIACWGVVVLTDPKGKAYRVA
ncbi:distal membrane-arm assembly complex protein 1 [Ochotona princeps]|uniref:distal membrane-arm assembly complex protein 1 n=1 Tax=Ochotona princeps TaxID=9978 RepID=UPI00032AE734|nr:distal membrane-arm assembly complex protein 1 [Ochotona princeps]